MARISVLLALLVISTMTFAQTNVDRLVRSLDTLVTLSFNGWKVSPDLKSLHDMTGDPTKPGFDDSKWDILRLNQSIYPDSCWMRREITLPSTYLGKPLAGNVKFLVSVDDYGYLWVNGESRGYFPWDGEFDLTNDAKPGQKFLIVIKAINTGGPLRLLRAELRTAADTVLRKNIEDFSTSLRVGQKLLGFDTYQTNARQRTDPQIDKTKVSREEKLKLAALLQNLAAQVNTDALAQGDLAVFSASMEKVRSQLKPVSDFAKRYTLYFDANAHIDAAWLWRDLETIEVCKNTFTSVLNMMDARPDFTYTQSAAAYYDWMEKRYPDLFKRMKQRIDDGRWEITGGMWIEPDCNLLDGTSWMRQLLYAKKYFKEKFGKDVVIGWNPDSFGYTWNMPMFYQAAGIDAFITQKIGWNERNVFPYRVFWWDSPDGSRVLSYFPFDYVNTVDNPYQLVDWMRQFDANTGFEKMLILFGVGDHGGGPSNDMLERIDRLKKLDIYPSIEMGTTGQYLTWLKAQNLSNIPVWNDELYLEYHQGTFTTQAKTKEWNRKMETLLTNTEKFSTLASLYGYKYNHPDLEEAWRNVLFNQFHDILPGSGIRENYIDADEKYRASEAIGSHELHSALSTISRQVNTSSIKNGMPLVVFNPLSWERSDVATVALPEGDQNEYALFDASGKELPSQIVEAGKYRREMLFVAKNIPALGYKLFSLRKQKPAPAPSNVKAASALIASQEAAGGLCSLENQFFRLTVESDSGRIKSIVDKRSNKEVLNGFGNDLQMLEDRPQAWDAWNVGLTGVRFPTRVRRVEVVEQGPVRSTIRVTLDYLKPGVVKDFPTPEYPNSFFTQDISLYDGIDRIDFRTDADWWEEKTMLKVAFPLSVESPAATYEVPYATIQRSTEWKTSWDSAKVEVPALRWADLSSPEYGVSLLNNSKYGYDIKGHTIRLSLLRSPNWPDPTADRGKHSMQYALYPHAGTWREAHTVERGYEYNTPLLASLTDAHNGKLPAVRSMMQLAPSSCVLTSAKMAEDGSAWIVQWYNSLHAPAEATLTLPKAPKKVVMTDALEQDGKPVEFQKNIVKLKTKSSGMVTVKIYF